MLVASGLIAGESLVGVGLAILAYFGVRSLDKGAALAPYALDALSAAALAGVCLLVYRWSFPRR